MVSGLISFPILTRVFTKDQYGIFSLIAITINLLIGISALGVNRSIIRFYENFKQNDKLSTFITTSFIVMFLWNVSIIFTAFYLGTVEIFDTYFFHNAYGAFILGFLWMYIQNLFTFLNSIFRLEDNIFLYNLMGILRKYLGLICAIPLVIYFQKLVYFYYGVIFVEIIVTLTLALLLYKSNFFSFNKQLFSKKIFLESFKYGFPLSISAIAAVILNFGDRYVIAALLDTSDVANYSVGYNFCIYLKELIVTPLNLALLPIVYQMWEYKQYSNIKIILSNVIKLYIYVSIPICILTHLLSEDIIVILASSEYIQSAKILSVLMVGILLNGLEFPVMAGLHFSKRTTSIIIVMVVAGVVNILLNLVLIPKIGILGSAYSTIASYFLSLVFFYLISMKVIKIPIEYFNLFKSVLFGMLSYFISIKFNEFIYFENRFFKICIILFTFLFTYFSNLIIFDTELRRLIKSKFRFSKNLKVK
ncbi:flippase [Desulfatiferula olefinivorans]